MKTAFKLFGAIALVFLLAACAREYDDSAIQGRLTELEKQVADIKVQIADLNSLVAGLKETIDQWKKGGYIEKVEEVDGGHTITFVGGKTVTLYNGKDGGAGKPGTDGHSPQIGVVADEDGQLYWAVDGEAIEVDGKKVPLAVIPEFSVSEEGHLLVTVNGEVKDLGVFSSGAVADSVIKDIQVGEESVTIVFNGGEAETTIVLPLAKAFKLKIAQTSFAAVAEGSVLDIPYEVVNANETTTVDVFAGGGFKASVDAANKLIKVTVPTPADDGEVLAWAQNDAGLFSMVKLSFTVEPAEEEEFVVVTEVDQIAVGENTELQVEVVSNVEFDVRIPEEITWLRYIETKSQTYIITFSIDANETGEPRSAQVQILRKRDGSLLQTLTLVQLPADTEGEEYSLGVLELEDGEEVKAVEDEGLTFTFDAGTGEIAPVYEEATASVILSQGNTLRVTSADKAISQITLVFDASSDDNNVWSDVGVYQAPTWTPDGGEYKEVTFYIESASQPEGVKKLKKLVVALGEEVVPPPVVGGETKVEKLWELLSTEGSAWNEAFGGTPGSDRNVAIDGDYVYIAEFGGSKQIWAIDITNPSNVQSVNNSAIKDEGYDGWIFLACPRVVRREDGSPILLVSNLSTGTTGWLYAYENGIDEEPKCIQLDQYGAGRRLGDTFTTYGVYEHLFLIFGSFWGNGFVTFQLPPNASNVSGLWNRYACNINGVGAYYPYPEDLTQGIFALRDEARVQYMTVNATEEELWATSSWAPAATLTRLNYSGYTFPNEETVGMNGSAAGYNFVEFNGKRYVIYARETMNTKLGQLWIREGEEGQDWAHILGIQDEDEDYQDCFYTDSFEGGQAATNSAVDVAVWETGSEVYIAVDKQRSGLALYRMYME